MKKLDYKILFLCLLVLLVSSFLLTGCTRIDEKVSKDEEKNVEEKTEEEDDTDENEDVVVGDFSKFSSENQEIGTLSVDMYSITSLKNEPMNNFHRFSFEVEGGRNLPNVSVGYKAELGALRILFKNIQEDNSGIGYQRAVDINEDGVVRIYHNISPHESEEIYDIGITKSTQFFLHSEKLGDDKWKINIDVRYPGDIEMEVDTGATEFSSEDQSLEGAVSSDGARITNYSFGVEDEVFRFIWTVRGSNEKPIPQVKAGYNSDDELVVRFTDLDSDYIGKDSNEVSLIGGVEKVLWNRVGNESIYRFVLNQKRDFRLRSFLSPNQVVLEIEL